MRARGKFTNEGWLECINLRTNGRRRILVIYNMEVRCLDRLTVATVSDKEVIITSLFTDIDIKPRGSSVTTRYAISNVTNKLVGLVLVKVNRDSGGMSRLSTSKVIRDLITLTGSSSKVRVRRGDMESTTSFTGRCSRDERRYKS